MCVESDGSHHHYTTAATSITTDNWILDSLHGQMMILASCFVKTVYALCNKYAEKISEYIFTEVQNKNKPRVYVSAPKVCVYMYTYI